MSRCVGVRRLRSDERPRLRRQGVVTRPGPETAVRARADRADLGHRQAGQRRDREVTVLLADFATVWNELFPVEQARIVQLLVERVDVQEHELEVRMRVEGLASLVGELRQQGERKAA